MTPLQNFATTTLGTKSLGDSGEQFASAKMPGAFAQALEHADFWPRFLAAAADFAILALFVGVVASFYAVGARIPKQFTELHPGQTPSEIIHIFGRRFLDFLLGLYILCNWLYFAAAESSAWQATPGKKITGLYVADPDGRKISFGRASARFFSGRLLLHLPTVGIPYFLIDCIAAAFPPRKQALHDRVARCVVFRKAPHDFSA